MVAVARGGLCVRTLLMQAPQIGNKMAQPEGGLNVAVVGATGQVGGVMLNLLDQRNYPVKTLRAFSSPRSAGKSITRKDQEITV